MRMMQVARRQAQEDQMAPIQPAAKQVKHPCRMGQPTCCKSFCCESLQSCLLTRSLSAPSPYVAASSCCYLSVHGYQPLLFAVTGCSDLSIPRTPFLRGWAEPKPLAFKFAAPSLWTHVHKQYSVRQKIHHDSADPTGNNQVTCCID